MNQIKEFKENPKSFLDKKESIKIKRTTDNFKTFINSLDKINELKPIKDKNIRYR